MNKKIINELRSILLDYEAGLYPNVEEILKDIVVLIDDYLDSIIDSLSPEDYDVIYEDEEE